MKSFHKLLCLACVLMLSACGGGNSQQQAEQSAKNKAATQNEQTDDHDHSDAAHRKQAQTARQVAVQNQVGPGDYVKDFSLLNLEGSKTSLSDYEDAKGVILIFSCNHCPYVKASEERMIELHEQMAPKGYPVVAVNSNDTTGGNDADSYQNMKKRAEEKGFPFAYLRDHSQKVARRFGAEKTPHVFLLERDDKGYRVVYVGAIDDNVMKTEKVKVNYVKQAIQSLEKGQEPDPQTTKAIGCSMKYKEV